MSVRERVADTANLLGLLLVLVTLFTSEQSRVLGEEWQRTGGARTSRLRQVAALCAGLAVITGGAFVSLAPLVLDVLGTCCKGRVDAPLVVFALVWILLAPLIVWQVALTRRAARRRAS